MRRIDIRVEEADGDALDPRGEQALEGARQVGRVQGANDGAVGGHPLIDVEAAFAWNQRRRLPGEEVVDLGSLLTADFKEVTKSPRREQTGHRPLALEQSVGCHRRPETDEGHFGRFGAGHLEDLDETRDRRAVRSVRRRGQLVTYGVAALLVEEVEVGECTADVHSNPVLCS